MASRDIITQGCTCKQTSNDVSPFVGPTHPLAKEGIATRNHKSGHVEDYNVHSFVFDEQHRTYDR